MATNEFQRGDVLDLVAPSGGVVSGGCYLIGSILCVAVTSAAVGEKFAGQVVGAHILAKTASQAWTAGDVLYWNNTTKAFTKTSASGLYKAGVVAKAALSADTTGAVRLDGVSVTAVP